MDDFMEIENEIAKQHELALKEKKKIYLRKWRANKKLKEENQAKVHQQQERKENGNDKAKQGEINEELRYQFVKSEKDEKNIYDGSEITNKEFSLAFKSWKLKHHINEQAANDIIELVKVILPKPEQLKVDKA